MQGPARSDYDALAATYDEARGGDRFTQDWVRVLADRLRIGAGSTVLDAGCGTGNYALPLAATGARVVGLDASRGMLDKARAKSAHPGWVRGDAARLPLHDARFDAGLALFVVHHLDWRGLFAEMRRVLRPGARFAVLTRSHAQLRASLMADFPGVLDIDLRRFPPVEALRAGLEERFAEVRVETVDKGSNALPVEEFLRRVRDGFISTFALMPRDAFEEGYRAFEARVRARHGAVVVDGSTFTLLVARRP